MIHTFDIVGSEAPMHVGRISISFCWALILMTLVSCGGSKEPDRTERKASASLQNLDYPELVPLADGGAYVISFGGDVWYLEGDTAAKVKGFPSGGSMPQIIASADGGAYASIYQNGIWRLERDLATRVHEVTGKPIGRMEHKLDGRERALFALWQNEIATRRKVEEEYADLASGRAGAEHE